MRLHALHHHDGHRLAHGAHAEDLRAVFQRRTGFGVEHHVELQPVLLLEIRQQLDACPHARGIAFLVGHAHKEDAAGQHALLRHLRVILHQDHVHDQPRLHVLGAPRPQPLAGIHVRASLGRQIHRLQLRLQVVEIEGQRLCFAVVLDPDHIEMPHDDHRIRTVPLQERVRNGAVVGIVRDVVDAEMLRVTLKIRQFRKIIADKYAGLPLGAGAADALHRHEVAEQVVDLLLHG